MVLVVLCQVMLLQQRILLSNPGTIKMPHITYDSDLSWNENVTVFVNIAISNIELKKGLESNFK
jgi:hypothetical protein